MNTRTKTDNVAEMDKHARLFAMAPDMLAALKEIASWVPSACPGEPGGMSIMDAIDIAESAIAKATSAPADPPQKRRLTLSQVRTLAALARSRAEEIADARGEICEDHEDAVNAAYTFIGEKP